MSLRRYRSVALAVTWRNLHNYVTNPALIVPGLTFPLLFFATFAGGLSRISQVPGFGFPSGYTAFQFVFVLLQSAAFGGVFTAFSVARDFESRFARRYLLAAPQRTAILAGYWLAGLCRWGLTAALITGIALGVGMEVGGGRIDLVGLYTLAFLLNAAAGLWAFGVALRLRTIQAGPAMQIPVFVSLFLAPVYVPIDLLDGWIHAVARINPVSAILAAGRGFISGEPATVALAFGLAAGLAGAFTLWALRGLRSAEASG